MENKQDTQRKEDCQHHHLKFKGDQMGIDGNYAFSLFNCVTCGTTIGLIDKRKGGSDDSIFGDENGL